MSRSYVYLLPPIGVLVLWWIVTHEHIWFIASVFIFFICMYLFDRSSKHQHLQKEAKQTKQLLTHIRHDQMNDVQVLMGYHSLNKEDKMSEYLNKLTERANREREIANFTNDELAVFLLTLPYRYSQWQWEVKITSAYHELPTKMSFQVVQWLTACMKMLADTGNDQIYWQQVVLTLTGENDQVVITIQIYDVDEISVILHVPASDWTNLKNQLARANTQLELVDQQQLTIRIPASR